MEDIVIGYQWGDKNQYIGEYPIKRHVELDVYVPPCTTLIKPPAIAEGESLAWNGEAWEIVGASKTEDSHGS